MSRRRIPPTSRPTPIPTFQAHNASLNNEFAEPVIKHVQFIQTNFSQKHEIANEFIIFIFTAIAASSQFVHLYRSVWWFQDSYTNYTVVRITTSLFIYLINKFSFQNFYLIDISLVVFIFVMIGRRFFYCLLVKILELTCPERYLPVAEKSLKYFFLATLEVIFFICNLKIFQNHSLVYLLYLIYP